MKTILSIVLLTTTFIMSAQQPKPTVDVTGKGIVTIIPDEVTITARIENTGDDAISVKRKNDEIINEVFKFLKAEKIRDRNIQTEYIRVSKNYQYNTKTYTYSANQSVSIKLTDLKTYESVMNGLLQTGINRIDGVQFSSSEISDLESQARTKAIVNAKLKATEYASALNQTIGKAVHISEFSRNTNSPQPMLRKMSMSMDAGEASQTMAPGELEIVVTINVSFELN